MRSFGIVALATALAGCAGRAPVPVVVAQPTDHYMDCTAILAEIGANNERLKQLPAKAMQTGNANIAGMFVPVLWFTDFQDAADNETTGLQRRQRYLSMMADQKRCGADFAPRPTARLNPRKNG
jgi:hypothetical protein